MGQIPLRRKEEDEEENELLDEQLLNPPKLKAPKSRQSEKTWWQQKFEFLWQENMDLRKKNADLEIQLGCLRASLKRNHVSTVATFVCATFGSIGIGAAPLYLQIEGAQNVGLIILVVSAALLLVAIVLQISLEK